MSRVPTSMRRAAAADVQFVNAVLVREGLARVSARVPLTRLAELQRAESEAQACVAACGALRRRCRQRVILGD